MIPFRRNRIVYSSHKKGFTLIETLVGSIIFVLIAFSAYQSFSGLMGAIAVSRAKVAATSVANEQIEIVRNLPYVDVGISGGLPTGKLARTKNVTRDGYAFTITTTIRSTDDTFDGTIGGNPTDLSPADYKLVDLDITCSNCKVFPTMKFTTLVAPYALETASTNGALFVQIFDATGIPIPGVSIHIVNTQPNPDIIIDDTTDNNGWIRIVDATPGVNAYNVSATKSGYTTAQTYLPGGAAGANPVTPDPTVVVQQVTGTSLSIDRVSTLVASSIDAACNPLPSVGFSLTGSKLIGTPSVLKFPAANYTTSAQGTYTISTMEWDTYKFLVTATSTYDLAGASILTNFYISPNETKNINFVAVPHVSNALLVSVQDAAGGAIDGATVQLTKTGFDQTKTTNTGTCPTPGQVFWNALTSGTYTMTVSKTGYQNSVTQVTASSWQNQTITLTP